MVQSRLVGQTVALAVSTLSVSTLSYVYVRGNEGAVEWFALSPVRERVGGHIIAVVILLTVVTES